MGAPRKKKRSDKREREIRDPNSLTLYRLYDDQDNLEFVSKHYKWFLPTYNRLQYDISRVDAIRYMILHHYGTCIYYELGHDISMW